ncbi:hypothetical protein PMAYCL1PPCAC_00204, partial [Pristionchus mayeri]
NLGGNLASIHNEQENSFIRGLAAANGDTNGLFIGGSRDGQGKLFGWIDGSDWDYANFYPGFPKNGFGDCLAMDTTSPSGLWMNMDCSAALPVACVRGKKEDQSPTCNTEAWEEGQ